MLAQRSAEFRFYEELNDFLPAKRRKRRFWYEFAENATVKQAVEALGVPHTEVDLIFINGGSVTFARRLSTGDMVSVYPQFEALDITPVQRLRKMPLRRTRFIADAHLGALAKYLRMLGFDTLFRNDYSDDELVSTSVDQRRILLTRDRALLMRRAVTHGCYVHALRPRDQLVDILSRLDLYRVFRPFTRCMKCNTKLESVDRELIRLRLPGDISRRHRRFAICPNCDRVYWEGTHYHRMQSFISILQARSLSDLGNRSEARGQNNNNMARPVFRSFEANSGPI